MIIEPMFVKTQLPSGFLKLGKAAAAKFESSVKFQYSKIDTSRQANAHDYGIIVGLQYDSMCSPNAGTTR